MKMNRIIKSLLASSVVLGAFAIIAPNNVSANHYYGRTNVLSNRVKRSKRYRHVSNVKEFPVKRHKHKYISQRNKIKRFKRYKHVSNVKEFPVKRHKHKYISQRVGNLYASEAKKRLYYDINRNHHVISNSKLNNDAQHAINHSSFKESQPDVYGVQYTSQLGKGYWIDNHRYFNDHNGYDIANNIMNNQIKVIRDTRVNILGKNVKQIGISGAYNHNTKDFYVNIIAESNFTKKNKRNKKVLKHKHHSQNTNSRLNRYYYKLGKKDGEAFGKENGNPYKKSVTRPFIKVAYGRSLKVLKNPSYQNGFRNNIMSGMDEDDLPEDRDPDCPWIIPRAVAYRTHNYMFKKGMLDNLNNDKKKSLENNRQYQAGTKWTDRWINKYVTHDGWGDNLYFDLL